MSHARPVRFVFRGCDVGAIRSRLFMNVGLP